MGRERMNNILSLEKPTKPDAVHYCSLPSHPTRASARLRPYQLFSAVRPPRLRFDMQCFEESIIFRFTICFRFRGHCHFLATQTLGTHFRRIPLSVDTWRGDPAS